MTGKHFCEWCRKDLTAMKEDSSEAELCTSCHEAHMVIRLFYQLRSTLALVIERVRPERRVAFLRELFEEDYAELLQILKAASSRVAYQNREVPQREVGKRLGCGKQRVSQLEQSALQSLRKQLTGRGGSASDFLQVANRTGNQVVVVHAKQRQYMPPSLRS